MRPTAAGKSAASKHESTRYLQTWACNIEGPCSYQQLYSLVGAAYFLQCLHSFLSQNARNTLICEYTHTRHARMYISMRAGIAAVFCGHVPNGLGHQNHGAVTQAALRGVSKGCGACVHTSVLACLTQCACHMEMCAITQV